mgnify:CR=1 FL=1
MDFANMFWRISMEKLTEIDCQMPTVPGTCGGVFYVTRPAEREQSQCILFAPKILTGALVRDTGTLRVSNNFF